jgi:hypothetical protein
MGRFPVTNTPTIMVIILTFTDETGSIQTVSSQTGTADSAPLTHTTARLEQDAPGGDLHDGKFAGRKGDGKDEIRL